MAVLIRVAGKIVDAANQHKLQASSSSLDFAAWRRMMDQTSIVKRIHHTYQVLRQS